MRAPKGVPSSASSLLLLLLLASFGPSRAPNEAASKGATASQQRERPVGHTLRLGLEAGVRGARVARAKNSNQGRSVA